MSEDGPGDSGELSIYRENTALQMLRAEVREIERTKKSLEHQVSELERQRLNMQGTIIWFEHTGYGKMAPAAWVKALLSIFGWSAALGLVSGLLLLFSIHWGIGIAIIVFGVLAFAAWAFLFFRTLPRA